MGVIESIKSKIPNIAKSISVYICCLIISMGVIASSAMYLSPALGGWVYLSVVIVGVSLGYLANKKISGFIGLGILVLLAIAAFVLGDMAIHSLNSQQHGFHFETIPLIKTQQPRGGGRFVAVNL